VCLKEMGKDRHHSSTRGGLVGADQVLEYTYALV
jgi:hypothetical protein